MKRTERTTGRPDMLGRRESDKQRPAEWQIKETVLERYPQERDRIRLQEIYDDLMRESMARLEGTTEYVGLFQKVGDLDPAVKAHIIAERQDELLRIAESQFRLEYTANRDDLTDLLNRAPFAERFGIAREKMLGEESALKKDMAVAYIDLDHLKRINDKYGHQIADQMLELVGTRLNNVIRKNISDAAGRFGGDEFVLLLSHMGRDEAKAALTRIYTHLANIVIVGEGPDGTQNIRARDLSTEPFTETTNTDGPRILERASFSVGCKVIKEGTNRESMEDLDTILKRAETAAYYMKHHHDRGGITIIDRVDVDGEGNETTYGKTYKLDVGSDGEFYEPDGEGIAVDISMEGKMDRDRVQKEVRESLNRTLGCVANKKGNAFTEEIREAMDTITDQVYEICYEQAA